MKKLIFSFLFLVIAGFAAQTISVHAETSPPAEAVFGAEETKVLSQALNILKIVLEDMRVLIASTPGLFSNSVELNTSLEAIKGNLIAINSTIENEALAYAERIGGTEAAALSQPVLHSPSAIKESPPLLSQAQAAPKEEVAAVSASVSQKNILWVVVVLVFVAGAAFVVRWWKKKNPELARAVVQEPQRPIVPMIREDNIQGIPPDY